MSEERTASELDTVSERVRWLLKNKYGGSRSGMARATGVSLSGLIKVVTGQQTPGRRLLETITQNTAVSPAWLLSGEGPPFRGGAIPVVTKCLPSPPVEAADAAGVPDLSSLFSPSRYWLRLGRGEPAVKASGTGLKVGDLFLMDTDRSTFPAAELLDGRWGVVRFAGREGPVLRLAEFDYVRADDDHAAYLESETFVHHPEVVIRFTVDERADGMLEVSKRRVRLQQKTGDGEETASRTRWISSILPRAVVSEDVVAVCVLLVRGFVQPH
jgi:hypothetical protein